VAGAPLAAGPRRTAATPPPAAPRLLEGRIGLLAPSANSRGRDEQLFAGLELALRQAGDAGTQVQLEFVRASSPLSPSGYRRAAAALLEKDAVDLVVALAQPGVAPTLAPLFAGAERALVVVDGGANLVRDTQQDPWVFYNTLGAWESSWALGRWAARNFGGEGYTVASGFEGGHDAVTAFRLGAVVGGHGEKGQLIPGLPLREAPYIASPQAAMEGIRLAQPAYVAAFLNRGEGLEFLRAFQEAGLAATLPLLGSPFLAEDALAGGLGEHLTGYITAGAWSRNLPTAENRAFRAAFHRSTGKEADAFAALGYDTGRMILAALLDGGGHARFLREALERAQWTGPGGKRAMDPGSHLVRGDVHFSRFEAVGGQIEASHLASEPGLGLREFETDALLRYPRPAVLNPYPIY
jgi:branched-chain amino acid transport system substrate-binding protein